MALLERILRNRYTLVLFLSVVAAWFFVWAISVPIAPLSSYGPPDEGLRFLIPKFIFEEGRLPTGYDGATINATGNWSYAFYPQLLGPIISAFFMTIMSIFNTTPEMLVIAARITSVLFGVIAVLFVGKSVDRLFEADKNAKLISYVTMVMVAAWPQIAFLSAYVNNDIIALSGVSIIIFACISGYKDRWNSRNASILAAGFVVCLLSYSNSYGFVLFGGLYFLITLWWQAKGKKKAFKLVGIVALVSIVFAGPFFIRNAVIYSGDVFGIATFKERTAEWELKAGVQSQHSYTETSGQGLKGLIKNDSYRQAQTDSAIARFGMMTIAPSDKYMNTYRGFILIGLLGCILLAIAAALRYIKKGMNVRSARKALLERKYSILLSMCILAGCVTTLALSLYYSLHVDLQPQGRYVIYILLPLIIASVGGTYFIITKLIVKKYRVGVLLLLASYYLCTSLIVYYKYIYAIAIAHQY